jgi:Zn-dependent protease
MILSAVLSIIIVMFSSILHEIAHGFVAYRLGDPTAKLRGRLTLNPIKHIDPYMSIILPIMLFIATQGRFVFGGAKPVPVDPFNLRDGRKDMALVALAGPLTNLVLAILAAVLFHLIYPHTIALLQTNIFGIILFNIVQWNLVLAVFNLLPIPPLDGSNIFALLLPERTAAAYLSLGSMGMLLLFVLLLVPFGGFSLMDLVYNLVTFSLSLLGF